VQLPIVEAIFATGKVVETKTKTAELASMTVYFVIVIGWLLLAEFKCGRSTIISTKLIGVVTDRFLYNREHIEST
jgi:hypothetical protein